MTRSRIAIFEGYGRAAPRRRKSKRYGAPLFNNPRMQGYGAPLFNNPRMQGYGAALFNNPRMQGYGFSPREMPSSMDRYGFSPREMPPPMDGYGRRAYYVPGLYTSSRMGPADSRGRKAKVLKRKGFKVSKGRSTKWQVKFKKAAKLCSRKAHGRGAKKGTYKSCMRKQLKKAKRSRR